MTTAAIDAFYAHLDACEQCREHPFDLCPVGGPLLMATAGPSKPFSMGATVTGRLPSAPRFQSMEPKTEFGKAMREAVERSPLGAALKVLDFDYAALERRMIHEFEPEHESHKDKKAGCPFCDAGIPFTDEKKG